MNITFSSKPQVKAYILNPNSRLSSLAFECSIGDAGSYRTYLFDIEWFINDVKMTTNKTKIEYHLLKMDGSLYIDDWNKGYKTKIGFHVRCNKRQIHICHFAHVPFFSPYQYIFIKKHE